MCVCGGGGGGEGPGSYHNPLLYNTNIKDVTEIIESLTKSNDIHRYKHYVTNHVVYKIKVSRVTFT